MVCFRRRKRLCVLLLCLASFSGIPVFLYTGSSEELLPWEQSLPDGMVSRSSTPGTSKHSVNERSMRKPPFQSSNHYISNKTDFHVRRHLIATPSEQPTVFDKTDFHARRNLITTPSEPPSSHKPTVLPSQSEQQSSREYIGRKRKFVTLRDSRRPTLKQETSINVTASTLQPSRSDKLEVPLKFPSPPPIPFMGNYNCQDNLCSEFQTREDISLAKRCGGIYRNRRATCHFMNGTYRAPVALVSFPGSGNTWVRGLLEKATEICTGSVYCDGGLLLSGMAGESMQSGSVLVVKTHTHTPIEKGTWGNTLTEQERTIQRPSHYGAAIVIVRNPLDALVAEWSRKRGGHIGETRMTQFIDFAPWQEFIHDYCQWWKLIIEGWIVANVDKRPLLVVKYEHVKADSLSQIKRMLEFLKVPYTDEELTKRLSDGFNKFKRKHNSREEFDHFTSEQREMLMNLTQDAVRLLQEKNNGEAYGIEDYLV